MAGLQRWGKDGVSAPPGPSDRNAIEVRDLTRSFRKRSGWRRSSETIAAVRGISFDVPRGTIFGLLGPNGAGKTTTIKMLSTLLVPTSGTATINGFDVVRQERLVRGQLGVLFGGDKGLYNQLSGYENLRYFGRLYGMDDADIKRRASELLERVCLQYRAKERVESYSRGMKQRLHIAKTLLHDPPVAVLDEPTIGLDPAAAHEVRTLVASLVPERTVLLTTHDMYEADLLCREVAIIDRGLIVARGSPRELKARAAVERRVIIAMHEALDVFGGTRSALIRRLTALPSITSVSGGSDESGQPLLIIRCGDATAALDDSLALLRDAGSRIRRVEVREPSLEDAFLGATNREFEGEDPTAGVADDGWSATVAPELDPNLATKDAR